VATAIIALAVAWQVIEGRRPTTIVTAATTNPARTPRIPPPEAPLPAESLSTEGAAVLGPLSAKATLIVYSDYQCPFCGKYERETYPTVKARYVDAGRLRMAFREFPLSMHPLAEKAAEAAECAGRQGKFWPMHDQLFLHQPQLDEPSLRTYAASVGVSAGPFDKCLSGEVAKSVAADISSGKELHITGTPTFLLGQTLPDGRVKVTKRWSGAQPLVQIEALIDGVLGAAAASR